MTMRFSLLFLIPLFAVPTAFANDRRSFELSRKCIGCDLTDFVSVNSNFTDSRIINSDLSRCNLSGSVFDGSFFSDVILDGCSLQSSSFKNVDLTTTSLKSADIAGSDFSGSKVSAANFLSAINWQYARNFSHLPLNSDDVFQGALDLYDSEKYEQSLHLINHLLAEYQILPSYLHLRSVINIQLGETQDAVDDILKSSDLYLDSGDIARSDALSSYAKKLSESTLDGPDRSSFDPAFLSSLAGLVYWVLF